MSNGFEIDDDGFINVYTDGACLRNGTQNAAAGIGVFFTDNNYYNVSEPIPYRYRVTNQVAEILAVKKAAKQALRAGIEELRLNTDSKFILSCVEDYIPKWQQNGWKKSDGSNVVNKIELEEMDDALGRLEAFDLVYVPAHKAYYGNEQADRLAKQGAARY